jgi:hypothetical protein
MGSSMLRGSFILADGLQIAPDNTCGYVGGSIGAIKTCVSTNTCGAVALGNVAVLACCNVAAGQCTALATCIDYTRYWSSSACDQTCQQDFNTIKWYVFVAALTSASESS